MEYGILFAYFGINTPPSPQIFEVKLALKWSWMVPLFFSPVDMTFTFSKKILNLLIIGWFFTFPELMHWFPWQGHVCFSCTATWGLKYQRLTTLIFSFYLASRCSESSDDNMFCKWWDIQNPYHFIVTNFS